jgi:hypothetical protein
MDKRIAKLIVQVLWLMLGELAQHGMSEETQGRCVTKLYQIENIYKTKGAKQWQ